MKTKVTVSYNFVNDEGVPPLATAKRVNRVTNRVMSPGTIVNRTSRRIDRFRAGRPRIKIYLFTMLEMAVKSEAMRPVVISYITLSR